MCKHLLYGFMPGFSGILIFMDTLINLCYLGWKKKGCNGNIDISLHDSILPKSKLINSSLAKRPRMDCVNCGICFLIKDFNRMGFVS